jgi:hypothetical protein
LLSQVDFSEKRIAAMLEDRRILLEEATSHRNALLQRLEIMGERLSRVESALQETAKNHILGKVFFACFPSGHIQHLLIFVEFEEGIGGDGPRVRR